ncbi:hypothetical protein [Pseudomonas putida]|uniref:hypothetical protein n=1 Tax=Pseudomonas putida TaxID=303 RepID=UPI0021F8EA61|nr:hypothetical protein [Pseudomonas putida]
MDNAVIPTAQKLHASKRSATRKSLDRLKYLTPDAIAVRNEAAHRARSWALQQLCVRVLNDRDISRRLLIPNNSQRGRDSLLCVQQWSVLITGSWQYAAGDQCQSLPGTHQARCLPDDQNTIGMTAHGGALTNDDTVQVDHFGNDLVFIDAIAGTFL